MVRVRERRPDEERLVTGVLQVLHGPVGDPGRRVMFQRHGILPGAVPGGLFKRVLDVDQVDRFRRPFAQIAPDVPLLQVVMAQGQVHVVESVVRPVPVIRHQALIPGVLALHFPRVGLAAVEAVGPQVGLADQRGVVAGVRKQLAEGRDLGVQGDAVGPNAVGPRGGAGDDGRARRHAERLGDVHLFGPHPFGRQPVQGGRPGDRVAGAAQRVGPHLVGGDENHVHWLAWHRSAFLYGIASAERPLGMVPGSSARA